MVVEPCIHQLHPASCYICSTQKAYFPTHLKHPAPFDPIMKDWEDAAGHEYSRGQKYKKRAVAAEEESTKLKEQLTKLREELKHTLDLNEGLLGRILDVQQERDAFEKELSWIKAQ